MKKLCSILTCIFLLTIILSSCSSSESSKLVKSNSDGEKWSVFAYICGTDLESKSGYLASINIEEMINAEKSENVNVIFQTGGAKEWGYEDIDPKKLQRYELVDEGFVLKDEQPSASMGQAETLGDYLKWGVENYPADKYMCLLWNHGGGSVSGVAFDELYGSDSLDLDELSQGLSMAGVQFEVTGFDACLMATIETAAAIAPYSKYMIASEEIEPGTGWDYKAWVSYLSNNSKENGLELGKVICDTYYEKCKLAGTESMVTLSVTDLKQVPDLVANFDKMSAEMKGVVKVPLEMQTLSQAIYKAENYGGNNDNEGYTNMADLGHLVRLAEDVLPEHSEEVIATINSAVRYKINGVNRSMSSGLSVFAPLGVAENDLDHYSKIAVSGNYLRYLEGVMEWKAPSDLEIVMPVLENNNVTTKSVNLSTFSKVDAIQASDHEIKFETYVKNNNYYIDFKQGYDVVQDVKYNLYFKDEGETDLYFLGSDFDLNSDDEKQLLWSNLRNVWPIINGNTCSLIPVTFNEDYIIYTVPILLNGERTNLRMTYSLKTNTYEVVGTWDGIDESGMSSKEIHKLVDGDEIVFLFSYTDLNTNKTENFEFGGFTVDGTPIVEEGELFESTFYYQFEVRDIFGNTYQSDPVIINSKDGKLTIQE